MPFIRIKKVKAYEYAYLVENSWKKRKKSSRQKTMKYLGRVHKLEQKYDSEVELKDASVREQLKQLLINHLEDYGFEKKENNHILENFSIDTNNHSVQKSKREISLQMNEGFMNSYTLKNLINFKPAGDEQEIAYNFANAFVSAGINVPQETFIQLYSKLLAENNIKTQLQVQIDEQKEDFKEFHY